MMDCRVKFATGPPAGRTRLPGNDSADRSRSNTLGINARDRSGYGVRNGPGCGAPLYAAPHPGRVAVNAGAGESPLSRARSFASNCKQRYCGDFFDARRYAQHGGKDSEEKMKAALLAGATGAAVLLFSGGNTAWAQTCADQHRACLARNHTQAECKASTDRCLRTGRWIGPAGREYPVSKRK